MLIKNADDFVFTDDFLMNEEEFDIPDMDTDDFVENYLDDHDNMAYFNEKRINE